MPAYGVYLAERRAVAEGGPPSPPPAEPTKEEPPSGWPDQAETMGFSGPIGGPRKVNETPGRANHRL